MSRKPTKAFFEQDNSAKPKGIARKPTSNKSNPAAPRPAAPKSATTRATAAEAKAKLSAFAFTKPAVTPRKTPHYAPEPDVTPTRGPSDKDNGLPTPTPKNRWTTTSLNEPPLTPAPRISISDLLAQDVPKPFADPQADDALEEHVTWAKQTPAARKRKRRAASSSPPPIPTPAGKYKRHQSTLQSTDPAMQLWNKYGHGGDTDSLQRPTYAASRLFGPDGVHRSPSSLRRATTIPENPLASNRLRRRKMALLDPTNETDTAGDDGFSSTANVDNVRNARINDLADQVKRGMKATKNHVSPTTPGPSSGEDVFCSSPPRVPDNPRNLGHMAVEMANEKLPEKCDSDSNDEFGDFDDADIDMDFLEKIDEIERIASTAPRQPQANTAVISQAPQTATPASDDFNEFGMDDDIFCGDEFESFISQFDTQTQACQAGEAKKNIDARNKLRRYQVIEVSEADYLPEGHKQPRTQKIVLVRSVTSDEHRKVQLRDSWCETLVYPKAFVHVVGSFDYQGVCVVDNLQNYIIVNPDFLVSATTVADTISCMRKAVLQERVRATGDISKPMIYGNVLHALLQGSLEDNDFSTENMHAHIDRILAENIESLFLLREDIPVATDYVRSKMPLFQNWAKLFLSPTPNAKATVTDHRGPGTPVVAINKLLDVEEHIWSPLWGLKGNIDATVQAVIIEPKPVKGTKTARTLTIPLELKTGRSQNMAHRAQTMLYTLLMSDRYDIKVLSGLLYYMETREMIRVPAIKNELKELVIKRNQVASFMCARETLPEMLQDEHACTRCYAKTACFVYHKLLEGGTVESSGVPKAFTEMTKHLNEKHGEFFKHWDQLLTKEEKGTVRFRREVWTMTSSERESAGRCFGSLVIKPGSVSVDQNNQKVNKYTYTFRKQTTLAGFTFRDSQLGEGDPIVISDEKGHIALAIGFIYRVTQTEITAMVDRRLHNARTQQKNFNEDHYQVFNGIVEWKCGSQTPSQIPGGPMEEDIVYRIDKDEFSSGMAHIRNSLVQLMAPDSNEKYRRLIVDLEPPVFKDSPTAYQLDETASQSGLNEDQKRAVLKVMSARDYALVLGMPGTGKTTTIAHIIRALVSQGKSVLLTSYTHTAVDNILLKIKDEKFGILRLGTRSKIHPDVQAFAQLADARYKTFDDLRIAFNKPKVVATTCLGINHPIFSERQFDYCIVDEASQITLPVCLGPIRLADAFILVGDHFQLPPLVKNQEAKDGGLDISLFKLLSEVQPQAVVNLEHQYRMCEEIMTLSNELIYSGRLKCGTPEVAKRALRLPDEEGLRKMHLGGGCEEQCWPKDLLREDVKACFVDTDLVPAKEEKKGDRTINTIEAELTAQIVEGFLHCGVDPSSIGVITVYRSQLKVIQHLLRHCNKVEMHTADKFQGRDKEIIVISLVRSNDSGEVGELLRDWRRINVAFTRARSKLIILGSKSTLCSNELLSNFVRLMERNRWVYRLPAKAHLAHRVERASVSASPEDRRGRRRLGEVDNTSPTRKGTARGKINIKGLLDGRPVLRNLANEIL